MNTGNVIFNALQIGIKIAFDTKKDMENEKENSENLPQKTDNVHPLFTDILNMHLKL